jgi:hypothetical protein
MQCSKQHGYSITSSAVASSVVGISKPSIMAVVGAARQYGVDFDDNRSDFSRILRDAKL